MSDKNNSVDEATAEAGTSTVAFGRWRLESLIAVGGLGELWRARGDDDGDNDGNDDVVALKRLHTHLARNDDVRAQFTTEQRLATQLPRHAHVVHAREAGDVDGRPYVALELAEGDDLRRILAPLAVDAARSATSEARVILPRARVRAIVCAAAEAAHHLHDHGYVHGDISPANLVVSTADHVTLVDLGVAREIGGGGVVRGTPAYMAPEQVRGERWTPATDVFALGIVLWELVSGRRLFHRGPPWLSLAAVVEAPVPPLDDPRLDALVQAALIKDPTRRIASAAELAAQLRGM